MKPTQLMEKAGLLENIKPEMLRPDYIEDLHIVASAAGPAALMRVLSFLPNCLLPSVFFFLLYKFTEYLLLAQVLCKLNL